MHFKRGNGDMSTYKDDVATLLANLASLKDDSLMRRVCERPYAMLSRFAREVRLLADAERGCLIEDAVDEERISEAEADELKWTEVIVWGQDRKERTELYLAVDIAWTVAESAIPRALTRAALLQKATGVKTIPVVLGKVVPETVRTQAIAAGIDLVVLPE